MDGVNLPVGERFIEEIFLMEGFRDEVFELLS